MARKQSEITPEIVAEHGLSVSEYEIVLDRLGREPNLTELGIFSVMWSEHCSYKSSRRHLGKFLTTGDRVIQGPGENAGVIDIDDGDAIIFKMESHNHPSFIEPYQGAATGVGGIMRDVFTMGARPIALLNALRFGEPDHPKTRTLVSGVVAGIGGYGNCVGVPTVGGETNFHKGYNGNILVNAMCVGLARADNVFYSAAKGVGNPIFYVGSKTGRDGIHGATMASAEFDDDSDEKRPTVQVGDPFTEKLLIEACLELMATDAIIAIQDMGAAGLTSSSIEMADKGGVGIELNLDKVPQREPNMTAYEMMLSESQERMLMVIKPGKEQLAFDVFEKWELDVAQIGKTTDTGHLVLKHHKKKVCDIPISPLADDAPNYDRPHTKTAPRPVLNAADIHETQDYNDALMRIISSPNIASKRWIWEQYDRHVMTDTVDSSQSGGDAAIVRIHGTNKAVAITTDCTPRYVEADPYEGGKQCVAETWRNLTCVGADPIAITDCLNFGNPERPEIMGQLVGAIEGMNEACHTFDYPVVSGNVSLYNETNGQAIPPTPAVGGVGLIPDLHKFATLSGAKSGDTLILIGETTGWLGCSIYLSEILSRGDGAPPPVDLSVEKLNGDFVRKLIRSRRVSAVHDLSDGGLAVTACEMAFASGLGIKLAKSPLAERHGWLFGEDQARYLISVEKNSVNPVLSTAKAKSISAQIVGTVGGDRLTAEGAFDLSIADLRQANENWLPNLMAGDK
ncbi:phosphoribosylformylglycinamidine synthase subunit PurL [Litorimonas cladophorae]|uniref:Phosphoribosylformylglycinamidine synthase subunit PurL n=1 Tax=Litorimonas cladophorae TaxID=1220491 RepID=A0A918KEB8_9PROT|nr:phosphoribosylformylglycinamidine synthase subunit PurL [Litorimonas cladophorae]GGX59954.1 phosphoribosylformylglycinamidine synthase subunit PurL [Litorimonas cladophorae]